MRNALLIASLLVVSCAHTGARDALVRGAQGRIHISDGGRGAALPVLFVHGNGANLTQWQAQLDHLRPSRRAVALDLRGMGKSDPAANGDYSIGGMIDDVDVVANTLRLHRFVIVGHSYGGAVVAAYAAKHPERVAGVVFADSAGNVRITSEAAAKFLAVLRKDKDGVVKQWFAPMLAASTPAVRDAVLASVHETPIDVFAGALTGLSQYDLTPAIAAYHGPRIAIAGEAKNPSALHAQFPEIPVRTIGGVGHWLMMDKPEELNRLLDEFLAGVK